METGSKVGARVRWTLAGLIGTALFYGLLISTVAGQVAAVLPVGARGWFEVLGGL